MLGNYGLAILATTVLVKAAFFPLANKSYESMAKMKKLQPEMEKIRERFKDDRVKQQQELMALYKNEKINPMAGCLPIAAADPGVLRALQGAVHHHRHAPCAVLRLDQGPVGARSDLDLQPVRPAAVSACRSILHVGVWPLIMGMTMWVQMQLNPQQPDPVQQKIFNWMPVIFTFMLASFPSGLVIYWAWNNVLSLLQQYTIMRKQQHRGPPVEEPRRRQVEGARSRGREHRRRQDRRLASARLSARGANPGQARRKLKKPTSQETQDKSAASEVGAAAERGPRQRGDDARAGAGRRWAWSPMPPRGRSTQPWPSRRSAQNGLNGSDHAIAARIDAARDILRGKEGA